MHEGLILHYTLHEDGAHLVRVLGDTPCPVLPDTLGGAPLVQIGAYAFSASSQKAVAHGQQMEECFGPAPAAAAPLCGNFLESVTLPDSVQVLGNAAFYNCRQLKSLEFGPNISGVGSDLFSNCRSLHQMILRTARTSPVGLRRVVNAFSGDVQAFLQDEDGIFASMRYPEFWEELEENAPAHIFQRGIRGRGYHYRQCFAAESLNFAEFDSVFPLAIPEEDPAVMAGLAFSRLRWPWALGEEARQAYLEYLRGKADLAACDLIRGQDLEGLEALCRLEVFTPETLTAALTFARKNSAAQAAALLTRSQSKRSAPAPKTYEF